MNVAAPNSPHVTHVLVLTSFENGEEGGGGGGGGAESIHAKFTPLAWHAQKLLTSKSSAVYCQGTLD